jgi:hypothetical protein
VQSTIGERIKLLRAEVDDICQSLTDPWTSTSLLFGEANNPIIADDEDKVSLYLSNLKMLWQLGMRHWDRYSASIEATADVE